MQQVPSRAIMADERAGPLQAKRIARERRVEDADLQRRAGHPADHRGIPRREPAARVPVGGTYHGVEEAGRFFSSLGDAQEPRHFEPEEFIAQGEKVVALGHYAWHVEATAREWESDFAHVFSVRDGKIARFQEYTDTAAIAEAFRGG